MVVGVVWGFLDVDGGRFCFCAMSMTRLWVLGVISLFMLMEGR